MACYTYKEVCYNIPSHIEEAFEEKFGCEPDGDPNYNGDCWTLTAMWIEEMEGEIDDLNQQILDLKLELEEARRNG